MVNVTDLATMLGSQPDDVPAADLRNSRDKRAKQMLAGRIRKHPGKPDRQKINGDM
jgi:hypothetical protein